MSIKQNKTKKISWVNFKSKYLLNLTRGETRKIQMSNLRAATNVEHKKILNLVKEAEWNGVWSVLGASFLWASTKILHVIANKLISNNNWVCFVYLPHPFILWWIIFRCVIHMVLIIYYYEMLLMNWQINRS